MTTGDEGDCETEVASVRGARALEPSQDAGWRLVGHQVFGRPYAVLRIPQSAMTAVLYWLVTVVALGGLGTWVAVSLHLLAGRVGALDVLLSVVTYVAAMCSTGLTDGVIDRDSTPLTRMFMVALGLLALLPVAVVGFQAIFLTKESTTVGLFKLICLMSPAWVVWALANFNEGKFPRVSRPDAAVGGDPLVKL